MRYFLIILIFAVASCQSPIDASNCHTEELLRIIKYDGDTTYQFETYYVHPTQNYDVEEGKKYTYCLDKDGQLKSLYAAS